MPCMTKVHDFLKVSKEANTRLPGLLFHSISKYFFFHSMYNETIIIRFRFCDIQNNQAGLRKGYYHAASGFSFG